MSGTFDKLVRMANQIAVEFEHQQGANAAAATCDHIAQFWDPEMRRRILAHARAGGEGLSATTAAAMALLDAGGVPSQTPATEFSGAASDAG
jgi:formate dehydrogenase subunit delta